MGYNAGGFGAIRFPDAAALAAWKKTKIVHDDFEWPERIATFDRDQLVAKRLETFAKYDVKPKMGMYDVAIDGLDVRLDYDTGSDQFFDNAASVMALFRVAAPHGAEGKLWFLSTAGGEGLFAYELTLAGDTATLTPMKRAAVSKLTAGADYQAFQERLMRRLMERDPSFAAIMREIDERKPRPKKKAK